MDSVSPTRRQQARAAGIAAELASLGLALPGTLIERHVRCGKPGCRCHADPPVLHGPYWQWTRKLDGKTITRLVPEDHSTTTGNGSTTTAGSAPWSPSSKPSPWPSPTPARAGNAARSLRQPHQANHHITVAAAGLTCGKPRYQHPFPQLTAKCKDLSQVRRGKCPS